MGKKKCQRISSFGSLMHFRKDQKVRKSMGMGSNISTLADPGVGSNGSFPPTETDLDFGSLGRRSVPKMGTVTTQETICTGI